MNESVKPANVLTEEELILNEKALKNSARAGAMYATDYNLIEDIIASHRTLNSRNAKLVHENDELMAENEMRKKYESFLKSVIRCRSTLADDYDFKRFKRDMRPLKHWRN